MNKNECIEWTHDKVRWIWIWGWIKLHRLSTQPYTHPKSIYNCVCVCVCEIDMIPYKNICVQPFCSSEAHGHRLNFDQARVAKGLIKHKDLH
jgi:hypothetical protein